MDINTSSVLKKLNLLKNIKEAKKISLRGFTSQAIDKLSQL
jgi:hypothetical protein